MGSAVTPIEQNKEVRPGGILENMEVSKSGSRNCSLCLDSNKAYCGVNL